MSSSKCIQAAVATVSNYHRRNDPSYRWAKQMSGPFPINYAPQVNTTPELSAGGATFYLLQVGVLRWCVELGRVDIITKVSELASSLVMPRQGHLEAILHVFNYLEKKHNARIVFDPSYADVDMSVFKEYNWQAFYGNVKEAIPPNAPPFRGEDVDLQFCTSSSSYLRAVFSH